MPLLKHKVDEQKIVLISKFTVERAKPKFRVVQHPYMVKLNRRSCVAETNSQNIAFPKYTFSLTPIEVLPQFVRKNDYFLGMSILFMYVIYHEYIKYKVINCCI